MSSGSIVPALYGHLNDNSAYRYLYSKHQTILRLFYYYLRLTFLADKIHSSKTRTNLQRRSKQRTVMCNKNSTCFSPDSYLKLCSGDGIARNQSSAFPAVALSTSVIMAIFSPVAVAGNVLVLAAVWRNPSLRTPSYILLCGLAFTDLCTGLVSQPLYVVSQLICWQKRKENNQLTTFLIYARAIIAGCSNYFSSLSFMLITLMSIERWLHMTRRSLLTVRRSCFFVALVSILVIPIAVLSSKGNYLPASVIFLVLLAFSLTATSVSYYKVFRIIRSHQQQVQANESPHNFGQPAIDLAKYKKSVCSILYILGVFYVSYVPCFIITALYIAFNNLNNELQLVFMISSMFLYLSSSLNPIIYIWRMTDVRNGVKTFLKKLFTCSKT